MILLLAFLSYLLAIIFHDYYTANLEIHHLSKQQAAFESFLRLFRWASFKILFAIVIIGGFIKIRKEGFSAIKLILPLLGSTLCLFSTWTTWSSYKSIEDTKNLFSDDKKKIQIIEKTLKELTDNPNNNSEKIHFAAKHRYAIDGKRVKYPNESGELVVFEPSEEDLRSLEERTRTKAVLTQAGQGIKFEFYFGLLFLIVCNIVGLFIPVKGVSGLTTEKD